MQKSDELLTFAEILARSLKDPPSMRIVSGPVHVLLVEPAYYTRYPPLGLLKLSTYHKAIGDTTELVRGCHALKKRPDLIYVTSLFTYAWKPVHEAVKFYKEQYPGVKIIVGGIYASLLPDHARLSGADEIHVGLFGPAENVTPDYELVPEWESNVLFASRGCVRKCGFCSVPKLEGRLSNLKTTVGHLINPKLRKIVFYDNNILSAANWSALFDELIQLGLKVDFNQGMDARCLTDDGAKKVSRMKMEVVRLAYDYYGVGSYVKSAIEMLSKYGVNRRRITVYTLYNYVDDPENFFKRVREILNWGAISYPMRYEPLTTLEKNRYVAPKWTKESLDMVAKARRVIGFGGAFPPYKGLVNKLNEAHDFHEAFSLRPIKKQLGKIPKKILFEMGMEHELIPQKKSDWAPWRLEPDWRKVKEQKQKQVKIAPTLLGK